ncbi:glycosyltransferase [Arthrospiribacter ruber]|uniref:Glycosyltransferase family 2 protein n=1 Tax=Arthrospiribacter ruber TaxID=2487934 RepID=A0A951IR78_9BACT|nr:glycosyltransferase family A protein [Arthrospiribacter ruber]MBW3466595.1 glycosyltransferase family 2 protein [Arthrospiribacter ruber]
MYFSVVVPTYQDSKLCLLLDALGKQTLDFKFWEVIIVNNDPENSIVLNQSYGFPITMETETKAGSYAARNKGLKTAKGEVMAFTDSDMLPDANWLEIAYTRFQEDKNRELGILTGPVPLFFKNPNKLTAAEVYEKYTGFDFESYAKEGACGAGNWFSYKSVMEEFGGFREDLKSNGDTELSLRISKKHKVVYVPELVNRHPARYTTAELVFRYRRILGGVYTRRFQGDKFGFFKHVLGFVWRRYRFALKKFFTVPLHESVAIFMVCNAINLGAVKEYWGLVNGGETRR